MSHANGRRGDAGYCPWMKTDCGDGDMGGGEGEDVGYCIAYPLGVGEIAS